MGTLADDGGSASSWPSLPTIADGVTKAMLDGNHKLGGVADGGSTTTIGDGLMVGDAVSSLEGSILGCKVIVDCSIL
ncbi:unnamed protein product [Linum trigynum]|uniref:Uncharacterized protein n=1 Tax=Linum trigynum TaxID=586398 RepID=A0AAV2EAX1_9ROSI